jgi:hypothetical protein
MSAVLAQGAEVETATGSAEGRMSGKGHAEVPWVVAACGVRTKAPSLHSHGNLRCRPRARPPRSEEKRLVCVCRCARLRCRLWREPLLALDAAGAEERKSNVLWVRLKNGTDGDVGVRTPNARLSRRLHAIRRRLARTRPRAAHTPFKTNTSTLVPTPPQRKLVPCTVCAAPALAAATNGPDGRR